VFFVLVTVGFAADAGKGYSWKPVPQQVEMAQGGLDIVLSDPLPQHWALTVIGQPETAHVASLSAGSVALDGPFIERVDNLDMRRLDVKPGVLRIRGIPNESGLAVCLNVPAGSYVRVLHDDLPIVGPITGGIVQDGRLVAQDRPVAGSGAKICPSVPVLQQAILGR
jgi:hypothetical protein